MSTHRLLSAAALRSGVAAAAIAPPAAAAPVPPAAAASAGEVDVVTVADATAAIATAEAAARTAGATAERERTAAVFASDEGRANPQMAAFMLSSAPGATSDAIVAQLKLAPAAAAPAPAPAAQQPAPPAPAAAAPLTHDLNLTPRVEPGAAANQGGAEGMTKEDQTKFWDSQVSAANASASSPFGAEIAPGLPRTGN